MVAGRSPTYRAVDVREMFSSIIYQERISTVVNLGRGITIVPASEQTGVQLIRRLAVHNRWNAVYQCIVIEIFVINNCHTIEQHHRGHEARIARHDTSPQTGRKVSGSGWTSREMKQAVVNN